MPINFFEMPCNNPHGDCQREPIQCMQLILNNTFGISDENGDMNMPAKIHIANPDPSIHFIVVNNTGINVFFKAIDWCIKIYRTGAYYLNDENRVGNQFSSDSDWNAGHSLIKRCEGFIQYDNCIIFIEIKNRPNSRGWMKDSREKFEETILSFQEHHPNLANLIAKPILSNPSFSGFHQNEAIQKKILKDKVGVEFIRQNSITI